MTDVKSFQSRDEMYESANKHDSIDISAIQ